MAIVCLTCFLTVVVHLFIGVYFYSMKQIDLRYERHMQRVNLRYKKAGEAAFADAKRLLVEQQEGLEQLRRAGWSWTLPLPSAAKPKDPPS